MLETSYRFVKTWGNVKSIRASGRRDGKESSGHSRLYVNVEIYARTECEYVCSENINLLTCSYYMRACVYGVYRRVL